jgi:hypothetical protein
LWGQKTAHPQHPPMMSPEVITQQREDQPKIINRLPMPPAVAVSQQQIRISHRPFVDRRS